MLSMNEVTLILMICATFGAVLFNISKVTSRETISGPVYFGLPCINLNHQHPQGLHKSRAK